MGRIDFGFVANNKGGTKATLPQRRIIWKNTMVEALRDDPNEAWAFLEAMREALRDPRSKQGVQD